MRGVIPLPTFSQPPSKTPGEPKIDAVERLTANQKVSGEQVTQQFDSLKTHLESLDTAMPKLTLKLKNERPWHAAAVAVLEKSAAETQEKLLEKFALSTISTTDAKPLPPAAQSRKQFQVEVEVRKKWNLAAQQFIDAYDVIETRLAEAYLLDEEVPNAPTLRELAEQWQDSKLLAVSTGNLTLKDAVEPVREPLVKLTTLLNEEPGGATGNLRARLVEAVTTPSSGSARRTAWQALRELSPPWPATRDEIVEEANLLDLLAAQFESIPNPARRKELTDMLVGSGERTLRDFFNRATQPEEIAAARDALNPQLLRRLKIPNENAFLVTVDRQTRFSIELLRLVANMPNDEKPADVKARITKFRDRLLSLVPPDATKAAQDKAYFAEQLKPYLELLTRADAPAGTSTAAPSGPAVALKGWTQKAGPDGTLEFTGPGGRTLTFVRLSSSDSYLCTEEVSVGLFLEVIRAAGKEAFMRSLLPIDSSGLLARDTRAGVRVWEWEQGGTGLNIAATWIRPKPNKVPFPPPEPKPAATHPMQYISARAAAYFAQIMNCRIPSSAEWSEAYGMVRQKSPGAIWNRRDQTWTAQRKYVADARVWSSPMPGPSRFRTTRTLARTPGRVCREATAC